MEILKLQYFLTLIVGICTGAVTALYFAGHASLPMVVVMGISALVNTYAVAKSVKKFMDKYKYNGIGN